MFSCMGWWSPVSSFNHHNTPLTSSPVQPFVKVAGRNAGRVVPVRRRFYGACALCVQFMYNDFFVFMSATRASFAFLPNPPSSLASMMLFQPTYQHKYMRKCVFVFFLGWHTARA